MARRRTMKRQVELAQLEVTNLERAVATYDSADEVAYRAGLTGKEKRSAERAVAATRQLLTAAQARLARFTAKKEAK